MQVKEKECEAGTLLLQQNLILPRLPETFPCKILFVEYRINMSATINAQRTTNNVQSATTSFLDELRWRGLIHDTTPGI